MTQSLAHLENENLYLREQLSTARAALQDFAYVVSHDLGAPLRAVNSFAEILQRKYAGQLDEKSLSYLGFVADGGARAQAMLGGLLNYSRIYTQATPATTVDMNAVVQMACAERNNMIFASQALIHYDNLPVIMADPDQMLQLMLVLLDNALLYQRPGLAPLIDIKAVEMPENWQFMLRDNGIGVPEKYRDSVFRIFKRLHNDASLPGIGMGLPIARRIVERHGGVIELMPRQTEGTICCFTLSKAGPVTDILSTNMREAS